MFFFFKSNFAPTSPPYLPFCGAQSFHPSPALPTQNTAENERQEETEGHAARQRLTHVHRSSPVQRRAVTTRVAKQNAAESISGMCVTLFLDTIIDRRSLLQHRSVQQGPFIKGCGQFLRSIILKDSKSVQYSGVQPVTHTYVVKSHVLLDRDLKPDSAESYCCMSMYHTQQSSCVLWQQVQTATIEI